MKIHREGYKIIFISTAILLAALYLLYMLGTPVWLLVLLGVPLCVLYILILRFFRDPERKTDPTPNGVVSPCDGEVVVIEEVDEPEYFNSRRIQISIFMSPLNVHVNRNPVGGELKYFKYHPGKYLVAWHPKSSTENERTTAVIKTESGIEVLFRQIAGAVARRIRWYIEPGMKLGIGDEMGFIKFGSRVDVLLPPDADIKVELKQKVSAAETLLAVLN